MEIIGGIVIVGIVFGSIIKIIGMGIRHSENLERMKRGYPAINGDKPIDRDVIDYTKTERIQ